MKTSKLLGFALIGASIGYLQSLLNISLSSAFLLLFAILFAEVFLKGLFLRALSPPKYRLAQYELLSSSDQADLLRYTEQLKQLGFQPISDLTISKTEDQRPFGRLFAHPQKLCFAEIGILENIPVYCSIFSYFEEDWSMGITNIDASRSLSAVSYAFMRLPRRLAKTSKGESVDRLFQSFLNWRSQVSADLSLVPLQDMDTSTYSQKEAEVRTDQRRSLLRKSIIWCLLEMLIFRINPKDEWLGAYKPIAS